MSKNRRKNRRCVLFVGPFDFKAKGYPPAVTVGRCGQTQPPAVLVSRCLKKPPQPLLDEYALGTIILGYELDPHIVKPDPTCEKAIPWLGTAKAGQFGDFIKEQVEKFFPASSPLPA